MARSFYEGGPLGQGMTPDDIIESILNPGPTAAESNAYHEAGHAVAAVAFEIEFDHVTILEDQENWGGVVFNQLRLDQRPDFDRDKSDHRRSIEDHVVVAFAGEASEALLWGREFDIKRPGASGDFEVALGLAGRLYTDACERAAFLGEMADRACCFVREPLREHQIGTVAQRLRFARELEWSQVVQLMSEMAASLSSDEAYPGK